MLYLYFANSPEHTKHYCEQHGLDKAAKKATATLGRIIHA